jgi:hypothetical protein
MSTSPFKSPAERADGLYQAYMHGWRAGAAGERMRAYSTLRAEQAAFEAGHRVGKDALGRAHAYATALSRVEPP